MFKTKLIEIFYTLSRNEQRALCRWVDSPAHNSREDVRLLCRYLYEDGYKKRDALHRELVYTAVYGQATSPDERKFHYLCSYLLQQIEDFLVYDSQSHEKAWAALTLAKSYRRLGLPEEFNKTMTLLRRHQSQQLIQDAAYHGLQYQIEIEDFIYREQQERNAPRNLQPMVYALDVQYIAEKIKQGCVIAAHEAVYKTHYRRGMLAPVLAYLQQEPDLLAIPAIGLYYYYYNITIHDDFATKESFFQQFKTLLLDKGHLFEQHESRDLYMMAINYAIRRFNTAGTQEAHLQETLQLYRAALQAGILLENGQISPFAFKNIVGIAMRLQELDWVEAFILQYTPLLPPKDRDTYTHYALSKLAFTRRDYPQAMSRLQKIEYSDLFLNLDAKVMLLKIYYELREYDALDALLQSFDAFLRRKNQLGYHRELYKNMLSMLKKLLYLLPLTPQKVEHLRTEINQTAVLGEKDWLLQQLHPTA